jgi:hypothetical protein
MAFVEFVALKQRVSIEQTAVLLGLNTRPTCAYRKSSPSIMMMQSTQDRTAQNAPRCLGGT